MSAMLAFQRIVQAVQHTLPPPTDPELMYSGVYHIPSQAHMRVSLKFS